MTHEDVNLLIEEIKRQLHLGHATLMVGAGFSRNIKVSSSQTILPPTWNDLKQVFVERLYRTFDENYQKNMYNSKTVLQLANEYEQLFDRSGLNELIEEKIQDSDILPGELHKKLLELPWQDVFTTNYDTLLERAAQDVVDRKYDTVYCCEDLALSESPRIIKLHGSIESEAMHMIITEEDYRKYPKDYAPFVNTVQQAITETTLCLIGFSGTDPNFLKWIGWVRDNLKDSMPPIYLIGKLKLSDSEARVLKRNKINPVDLSMIGASTDNDGVLINRFLDKIQKDSLEEWDIPTDIKFYAPSLDAIQNADCRKKETKWIIQEWKEQRCKYPNWLVVPYTYRRNLVKMTERWIDFPKWCSELSAPQDIQGLYEYNWRMEHCLMPIINDDIEYYELILKRHNPLNIKNNLYFTPDAHIPQDEKTTQVSLKEMWIQLMFAVLRWQREENHEKGFELYKNILQSVVQVYPDYSERLYYERTMFALSMPNLEELNETLKEWENCLISPEWKLKYASLIAEMGDSDKAVFLLRSLLPEIRQSIPKNKIKKDYYWLGLEGVVLVGLCACEDEKRFDQKQTSTEKGDDDKSSPQKSIIRQKYKQRLNVLRSFHCDPWEELDLFQQNLSHPVREKKFFSEKRDFDTTTKTFYNYWGWDKEITVGYHFLRYLETTGLLQHLKMITIADIPIADAVRHIAPYSPSFAFTAFNRVGAKDKSDYELFFSQSIVYEMSQEEVDNTIKRFIREIFWIIDNAKDRVSGFESNYYKKTFKHLLESISRLLVKATPDSLQAVFDMLLYLYNCNIKLFFMEPSPHQFIRRFFEAIPSSIIRNNIDRLLHVSPPENISDSYSWVNPFDYLYRRNKLEIEITGSIRSILDTWIERLNSPNSFIKKTSLKVLFASCDFGIMNDKQKNEFARNVLGSTDSYGLPTETDFYPWVFLRISQLSGDTARISKELLDLYCNYNFALRINKSPFFSPDPYFECICYSMLLNLSTTRGALEYKIEASYDVLQKLFYNIKKSIETANKALSGFDTMERESAIKNIRNCLLYLDRIIAEILIPRANNSDVREQIKNIIRDAEELQPFPSSKIALLQKDDVFPLKLTQELILAITSSNREFYTLYSYAIANSCIFSYKNNGPDVPSSVFSSLISAVGMKQDNGFCLICDLLTTILSYYTIDQQDLNLLMVYLGQLKAETLFSCENSRFPYESRYDYRVAAGGLAARVYKLYKDKGDTIPEALVEWEKISHSSDEFPSLRNKWDGVINYAE